MSYSLKELMKMAADYENLATRALAVKTAKKEKKKLGSKYYDALLNKFAVGQVRPEDIESSKVSTQSRIQSINAVNTATLTPDKVKEYVGGYLQQAHTDYMGNQISQEQYSEIVQAGQQKMFGTDNRQGPVPINWNSQPQSNVINLPTQTMVSPKTPAKPQGWTGPKIDPVFQTMLGVNPDGKLGRQTQAALDIYKKSIRQPGVSNELAFENLKREPQYKAKQAIPYDDNANVYQVTREKESEQLPPNPYEAPKTWGG